MIRMFFLMLALSVSAHAFNYGTYTTPAWPLRLDAEPAPLAAESVDTIYDRSWIIERCVQGSWSGHTCPHEGENGEWSSDWSYVKCYAHWIPETSTEEYGMHFQAHHGAWPTIAQWTAHTTVTCSRTEGSDSVAVQVPIGAYPDSNGTGTAMTSLASLGTTITLTLTGAEGGEWDLRSPIPSGTYITGLVTCKHAGGTSWPELTADVVEGGSQDTIRFQVSSNSWTTGTTSGYCPISKSGVITNVPVNVVIN